MAENTPPKDSFPFDPVAAKAAFEAANAQALVIAGQNERANSLHQITNEDLRALAQTVLADQQTESMATLEEASRHAPYEAVARGLLELCRRQKPLEKKLMELIGGGYTAQAELLDRECKLVEEAVGARLDSARRYVQEQKAQLRDKLAANHPALNRRLATLQVGIDQLNELYEVASAVEWPIPAVRRPHEPSRILKAATPEAKAQVAASKKTEPQKPPKRPAPAKKPPQLPESQPPQMSSPASPPKPAEDKAPATFVAAEPNQTGKPRGAPTKVIFSSKAEGLPFSRTHLTKPARPSIQPTPPEQPSTSPAAEGKSSEKKGTSQLIAEFLANQLDKASHVGRAATAQMIANADSVFDDRSNVPKEKRRNNVTALLSGGAPVMRLRRKLRGMGLELEGGNVPLDLQQGRIQFKEGERPQNATDRVYRAVALTEQMAKLLFTSYEEILPTGETVLWDAAPPYTESPVKKSDH